MATYKNNLTVWNKLTPTQQKKVEALKVDIVDGSNKAASTDKQYISFMALRIGITNKRGRL
ncbi:hypothetical protein [Lysinibacillus xylanilyticus]|uniref:hypothetical protein n=1 Tax=Lysinibacillus xylanilyticus TaxID=582475 RepID=UPI003D023674